jgi:hypothetical protein
MDGLELGVGEPDLDQHRQAIFGVKETLEVGQRVRDLVRRWRHERGFAQKTVARADPVLSRSQLPRRKPPAAHTTHELLTDFADGPYRDRKGVETLQPVVHRVNVVDDFAHVCGRVRIAEAGLGSKKILK